MGVSLFLANIWKWLLGLGRDQYVLYLFGCGTFSMGAAFFIASHLGTDPLDVMALGLVKHLPLTVGLAQGGFAALCLLVYGLWNRTRPPLSPFFTFFFCGSLIDLWMNLHFVERFVGLSPYPMMLAGVVLCAYGSSLIIMSGIGIRAMDLVALTMVRRWKLPFWLCKGVMEVLLLAAGWVLGGPIGIGTLFFLAFVGWLIQPLIWINTSYLRLEDYGLKQARVQSPAS